MGIIRRIALVLVLVGALNWGLIGFFNYDLVTNITGGAGSFVARIVYALVGLSALLCITLLFDPIQTEERDENYRRSRNHELSTEFGEEVDFDKIDKDKDKDKD